MAKRTKVLTVTIRMEMGNRKISGKRVRAVAGAVVDAAQQAAAEELLENSLDSVTGHATWAYEWLNTPVAASQDWEDDLDEDDADDAA
ncbi:hypothetical protein [Saccharopolyspora spinosa]|uniref:Uncharacterized protein n=1 Tax=Saccharopolyspora spinosa TaxID=60894 RepID=A0A2N3Y7P5_SACSN|nr:hypothetical protein [Saccharopolyspora spinosa]PKW18905.1 hypothetical protein A8926_7043 [Saccharopolyspora spinosa]